jgi:hypothetical protein
MMRELSGPLIRREGTRAISGLAMSKPLEANHIATYVVRPLDHLGADACEEGLR